MIRKTPFRCLLAVIAFFALQIRPLAYGGAIPEPFTEFIMGMGHQAHITGESTEQWITNSGDPWDAVYRYLIGGPRSAPTPSGYSWWDSWPGSGGMIANQLNDVDGRGMVNMFVYEQMYTYGTWLGYSSGNGSNSYSNINTAFNDAQWMGHYYQDFASLIQLIDTWLQANPGKYVYIDMEPDVWGFMQQQHPSDDPDLQTARVASATNPGAPYPDLTGLANTVAGYAQAIHRIRDQFAPTTKSRIKLAFHASAWQAARVGAPPSLGNVALAEGFIDTTALGNAIGGYINQCRGEPGVGDWDLIFVDPSDGDAGLYDVVGDPPGFTHWWDTTNATQPSPDRYRDWCNALSTVTDLRIMLWQVPIGNSAMPNTNGHYQDNKAEYFFDATNGPARVCDYADNGVIGILWGRGAMVANQYSGTSVTDYWYTTGQTEWSGGTSDGCTVVYPGAGSCPGVVDDDGGYLDWAAPNYFNNRCTLPGVGSPTPSFTPSPNWTATPTPSPTPDCPTLINGIETLTDNGSWSGAGATRALSSGTGVTQGSSNLRVDVTAPADWWNTTVANLAGFTPNQFGAYTSISLDIYFDPGNLPWGGSSNNIAIYGDAAGVSKWSQPITADVPVSSGMNNLDIPINLGLGTLTGTDVITTLMINLKFDNATTGRFYVDNIQLHTGGACPSSPTPTNSPSATRTATPSRTRTATPSVTPSPSASPTSSATSGATYTATRTVSQTTTPTATLSRTASITESFTPSHTPVGTLTDTPTATPVDTVTATPTITESFTASHTPAGTLTDTPVDTQTASPTPWYSSTGTNTVTPTSSPTATPSVTNTPGACPPIAPAASTILYEDFEAGAPLGPYQYDDGAGSSITTTASTAQAYSGTNSLLIQASTASGTWGGGGGLSASNYAAVPWTPIDVTGATTFRFVVLTDQDIDIGVTLTEAYAAPPNPNNESFSAPSLFSLTASPCWQLVEVDLSTVVENLANWQCGGTCATDGDGIFDQSVMASVDFYFNVNPATTGANVYFDDLEFVMPPATATPTMTPTPSRTATPTVTLTNTIVVGSPTPSVTATPTQTQVSPTPTATPSMTLTSSFTSTVTVTMTPSVTQTPADSSAPYISSSNPASGASVEEGSAGPGGTMYIYIYDASGLNVPGFSGVELRNEDDGTTLPAATVITDFGAGVAQIAFDPAYVLPPGSYSMRVQACDSLSNCAPLALAFNVQGVSGPNDVLSVLPAPNPNPAALHVQVAGPVDSIEIQVYSKSMVSLGTVKGPGRAGRGWQVVPLAGTVVETLANDIYYLVAYGVRGNTRGQGMKGKLVILK